MTVLVAVKSNLIVNSDEVLGAEKFANLIFALAIGAPSTFT